MHGTHTYVGVHSVHDHVSSFFTNHTLYSQSDPASLAVTASAATMSSAIDTMHSTSSRPTHQRFVISTILRAFLYESLCIAIKMCTQIQSVGKCYYE